MGILQPSRVNAVVAAGVFVYCTKYNILPTIKTQKTDVWDIGLRAAYVAVYGEDLLQSLWDEHCNFCKDLHNKVLEYVDSRPDLKDIRVAIHEQLFHGLGKIRCPVLLVHGDKVREGGCLLWAIQQVVDDNFGFRHQDPLVGLEHATYCHERIANCQLKRFADASHNVHQTHATEFRDLVVKFFEESDDFF